MKTITADLLNRLQMKTNQFHRNTIEAIAKVRALVEREFSILLEREPRLLRQALNEAEAIAWQTGFPQLIFPSLALEKASAVAHWESRQRTMRHPSPRETPGA